MARPRRIRNPYPHRDRCWLRLSSAVLTCVLLAGLGPALTASTANALGLAAAGVPPDGPPGNPDPPGPPNDPPPQDPPPNDPPPQDPPPQDPPPNDPPPNDPPPNDPPPRDPPPNDPPPRDPPPDDDRPCKPRCNDRPPCQPRCDDRPPCQPRCDDRPPCHPRCDDRPPCERCDDRPPRDDFRRPFVLDEFPRDGAFRVSTFTDVLVTFSESVRGVDRRSFRLFNARTGRSVFADVFRNGSSRRWVLDPDGRLSRNTRYVAVLRGGFSGIRDFAGNRLSTTTWTFRTSR